jgi:hypothetical protein
VADSKISDLAAATAPALADYVEVVQSGTNKKEQWMNALGLMPIVPGGRLTLTTGVPVTTSDVTGATTIYWTPYLHGGLQLWDGNQWQLVVPGEISLALGTLTSGKPYDVFGFLSGGTLAMESLVWTNDTTRATAVTYQDSRLCKSGDKTRRLLGTFYTTSTTTTEDSAANRYLSNLYNAVRKPLAAPLETTDTWTYGTNTWRQANANTANQLNFLVTYPGNELSAELYDVITGATNAGGAVGIGLDSTSSPSTIARGFNVASGTINVTLSYSALPAAGRHFAAWLEIAQSTHTIHNNGDGGLASIYQSALTGAGRF